MTGPGRHIVGEKQRQALARRLAGLDHRRLLCLHEAVQAGSVRGAAERLGVSPSSLSRQIMKVEAELGLALLERHGRGVSPTEAGRLLDAYVREQRERLDGVIAEIQEIGAARRGLVSLGMGEGFLTELMGAPLRGFAEAHPALQFDVRIGGTDALVRRLLDDTIQIALLYNLPVDARLQSHAAQHYPMRIVVRPDHPLARLGRKVSLEDLRPHALGLLPGAYGVRQALFSAEHHGRLRLTPRLTTNSLRALLHFAENWGGVLVTTSFAVSEQVAQGRLIALEAEPPFLAGSEAHIVTRRGRRLSPAAAQLLRHLRASLPLFRI